MPEEKGRKNFLAESYYRHGYEKALRDVFGWFEKHSESIKYFRMYNQKGIYKILSELINRRDDFYVFGDELQIVISKDTTKNEVH